MEVEAKPTGGRCPLMDTVTREPERSEGRTQGQAFFGYFLLGRHSGV